MGNLFFGDQTKTGRKEGVVCVCLSVCFYSLFARLTKEVDPIKHACEWHTCKSHSSYRVQFKWGVFTSSSAKGWMRQVIWKTEGAGYLLGPAAKRLWTANLGQSDICFLKYCCSSRKQDVKYNDFLGSCRLVDSIHSFSMRG